MIITDTPSPACVDIEKAILCTLLRSEDKFLKYSPQIKSEYFYNSDNKKIFEFMQETNASNKFLVCDKFPDLTNYVLEMHELADHCDLEPFIEILKDRYNRRKLIDAALATIQSCETDYDATAREISEAGISSMILDATTAERPELIADIAPRLFDGLEIIMKGEGIKTGLKDVDDILGALQAGEYIILAGRPSMGKTALALCIARKLADQKITPLIFSVETSKETMCGRIIFGETECSFDKILRGSMTELARSSAGMSDIISKSIYIDGTPAVTLGHIEATAENYVKNHGVNFLMVDHVGLVKNKQGRSRHEELSEISKGFKALLQKLKIPGIIICQLSRKVEERRPPIPMLSDLRESGSLEEDSDKVIFIYRDEYYNRKSEKKGIAEIIIAKNKNGKTGYCEVQVDLETMNFRNLEKQHEAQESWVK
jgi:replicative DNA helicase